MTLTQRQCDIDTERLVLEFDAFWRGCGALKRLGSWRDMAAEDERKRKDEAEGPLQPHWRACR